MKRLRSSTLMFLLATAHVGATLEAANQGYIEVTNEVANIRTASTTNSQIVGQARQGDIFRLEEESGNWYRIQLFSGDSRYVYRTLARIIGRRTPQAPDSLEVRRNFFYAWQDALSRAQEEAAQRFAPDSDRQRYLQLYNLLLDRYQLDAAHEWEVQPAAYRRIIIEGSQAGW